MDAMVKISAEFPANGDVEMSEEDIASLVARYGGKPEKVVYEGGRPVDLKWRDGRWI